MELFLHSMWCLSTETNVPFKLLHDSEKCTKKKQKTLDIRPNIATECLPLALIQEIAHSTFGVNICIDFSASRKLQEKGLDIKQKCLILNDFRFITDINLIIFNYN